MNLFTRQKLKANIQFQFEMFNLLKPSELKIVPVNMGKVKLYFNSKRPTDWADVVH